MPASTDRSDDAAPPFGRYDLLLVAIPLALLGGVAASVTGGVPVRSGVSAGSAVAALAVGYALFGEPPRTGRGPASA